MGEYFRLGEFEIKYGMLAVATYDFDLVAEVLGSSLITYFIPSLYRYQRKK